MVKVINISSQTIEIANVNIKPHTGYIFEDLSLIDRQKLSAMSAVGLVRAYDGDYNLKEGIANQEPVVEVVEEPITEEIKPTKKSNKKK